MRNTSTLMRTRRPFAVQALNRAGKWLEKAGILKLEVDDEWLMDHARRHARLEDFGDDGFREPLRRLAEAIKCEARLNLIGKLAFRQDSLHILINRLEIERDRAKYPEISAQKIEKPIFIIGLPRTGTTILHSLLGQDPGYRVPLTWEVMSPSPPTADGEARRIRQAAGSLAWLNRLAPDFKAIHLVGAELPQECIAIMSHVFMSDQFDIMFNVPGYRSWLEQQDMKPAYAYHRRFLQHLQYRHPARRWVLKAPAHMLSLGALFAAYPDAQIVQTHREPLEVLASTASLSTLLRATFSDFVDPEIIGRETCQFWGDTLDIFMRLRENHPRGQFFDLDYSRIVEDPIGAVRSLYEHFGNELTPAAEQRMREFLAGNPKDKHGPHRYTLAQFGIDASKESGRFDRYRERFNLTVPQAIVAT